MGCWNETCMISHLPIHEGEQVGAVILARVGDSHTSSHCDEVWKPVSPVFMGEYTGYGSISVADDDYYAKKVMVAYHNINKSLPFRYRPEGKTRYEDVNWGAMDTDSFLRAIHDGECKLSVKVLTMSETGEWAKTSIKTQQLALVLIKKPILDFINEHVNAMDRTYPQSTRPLSEAGLCGATSHTELKELHAHNVDVSSIIRLGYWMNQNRLQWMPTSGSGSQGSIESKAQVDFYELQAKLALETYWENGPEYDD